ncbi:MAG: hypothetical protein JNJ89_05075 [Rubrivivax sp.]|nr:hypothetical protein [Rubrivivax sp.]
MTTGLVRWAARALPVVAAAGALGASAAAYTTEDLKRDARAHHARMMQTLRGVRITQSTTFTAPGAGQAGGLQDLWLQGDRWRIEGAAALGGAGQGTIQSTTLFDGKDLWMLTMGMKVKLPGGQGPAPFTAPWGSLPDGTEVVGSDRVSGRDCWMLRHPVMPRNRAISVGPTQVCIDKKQFMLLMTESVLSGRTVRTTMSDFRAVKGYEFPQLSTTTSNGTTTMTSKVTRLEVGVDLPEDLFDPAKLGGAPAGGARK